MNGLAVRIHKQFRTHNKGLIELWRNVIPMTETEKLKRVAKVIKRRHPNLTVEETIDFAAEVLAALAEV